MFHTFQSGFLLLFFFCHTFVFGQLKKEPVAKFSFNNRSYHDEVSHKAAKLKGVSFTEDRFGNENFAVYLFGNEFSYINLGSYSALKPTAGSISFWVKVENEVWAGRGRIINPFILTKNTNMANDFYEAYSIGYYPETKTVIGLCTKDSTRELSVSSIKKFEIYVWHHLVMTFDDAFLSFYIDGEQIAGFAKNFRTQFRNGDSVLVGATANKKNHRFLNASFDDLEFYNTVLTAGEVYDLYTAPNPNRLNIAFNWSLLAAAFLAVITGIYFFIRYRLNLKLEKEKERFELSHTALETELRVNRALMNPHFVFNSLNALQHFILKKENVLANTYLIKFSRLIRKILESNMADSVSLDVEIDIIKRYLEIEDMRFEENILYVVKPDPDIVLSNTYIPVMMIQPFIENAIWHGLLNKEGEKKLTISFSRIDSRYILCVIEDNGVGRKKTEHLNLEKKSLATAFVIQRLGLLNKIHQVNCTLTIEDGHTGEGTRVELLLPILTC